MDIDIVNVQNQKVGSLSLSDAVFGGRVKTDLIWTQVVHENASKRRGTHATKTRGLVSGTGKKPWKQKGTGRARVGEARNPLWRKGGTVFGPQPRDYGYALPKKMGRGALRSALTQRFRDNAVVVVDAWSMDAVKTKVAVGVLKSLGATGKTLLIDVHPDEKLMLSTRNIAGIRLVPSNQVTARDVMDARRIIATRAAVERLQEVLAS
ncbi:MAG: 50S ribosomal protein L4 [Vicinamibacterales bacterium]